MTLSPAGQQLILDFEVGGGAPYYLKLLASPTWPGFASGVTVGVGYDLGYNAASVIRLDWRALPQVERLAAVAGITGQAAKPRAAQLRDIRIPWEPALRVFNAVTVTRYYEVCRRTYPGFDDLRPNAQAAILSLTFNRGEAMSGPRRLEMRNLRALVPKQDYRGMAAQLRAMVRIWRGTDIEGGMTRRRLAEARLMETP